MFRLLPVKLHDCQIHGIGSEAELFIVEGDSASKNVVRVRNRQFQAVLPMQGKPLNARKASKRVVGQNELYQQLVAALGAGWDETFDLSQLRYDRVILLFDPDADGIHCVALMLMFFQRWMPALLDSGRIQIVRPPAYEFSSLGGQERIHAYSEQHFCRIREQLHRAGIQFQSQRYRGLASINADSLMRTCVAIGTRHARPVSCQDAEQAIKIFGGKVD